MNSQKNKIIFLIGLPGSGKTHIGNLLSKSMSWNFIDMDDHIEKYTKNTISDIFKNFGETYFRKIEFETLQNLKSLKKTIISTGGGCVVSDKNKSIIKNSGTVIWLKAEPETLHNRLNNINQKNTRPLLGKNITLDRIINLSKERKKHYFIADLTINTDNKTTNDVKDEIIKFLRSNNIEY